TLDFSRLCDTTRELNDRHRVDCSAVQTRATEFTVSAQLPARGLGLCFKTARRKSSGQQLTANSAIAQLDKQSAGTMSVYRSYNPRGAHERAQRAEITRRLQNRAGMQQHHRAPAHIRLLRARRERPHRLFLRQAS